MSSSWEIVVAPTTRKFQGNKEDGNMGRCASLFSQLVALFHKGQFYHLVKEHRTVTRMKGNADYTVIEENLISITGNVLSDQPILFNGFYAQRNCPHILHGVVAWDNENECEIVLLTNHLKFSANTLSTIYKDRLQIELSFKALKQNLRIKSFVGTSENALYIQIWRALSK
jgi:IS4 transposase